MRTPTTVGYKELKEDFPNFGSYGKFYHPLPEVYGEMSLQESAILSEVVHSLQPTRILEIGRCRGGSSTLMALACESSFITTVDLPEPESLYKDSNSNSANELWAKEGIKSQITEVLEDSNKFKGWEDSYDFILLDGSHKYQDIYKEIQLAHQSLNKGGFCFIHDQYKRNFPGVTAAIAHWAEILPMKWISKKEDGLDTSWVYFKY
jgi:cephalosporin hydroxylase